MRDAGTAFGNRRSAVSGRLSAMSGLGLARGLAAGCVGAAMLAATAGAQLAGANKTPGSGSDVMTLHETVRLVVETVTVKDKQGKFVPGLTKKDFSITEDGVPQTISFCELQSLPEVPDTPIAELTTHQAEENIKIYNKLSHEQIAGEAPGKVMYQDKRLLVLYFDDMAMPNPTDQMRSEEAAQKFVRTQMTSADLVSIMRFAGNGVEVLQDFTGDRNRLLSILETMVVGEGQGNDESTSDDSASDTGAAFGQDDSEFNIFTTDRQLAALQTAAEMLGRLNEKKQLIYFASGLNLNGLDNQAQMHATEDAALRSGVTFWAVDARGLVAEAPMGDATRGSPGSQAMYTGGSSAAMTSNFQRSQDTLYAIAGDTGGKAFLDNNDLSQGIVQAQKAVSDYYIIGYYTSNTALNGKFRKVKVTLGADAEAKLDYQQGYFAGKEWGKFNTADKERQLEDALMQGDPWTDLTVAVEVNYFQLNKAEYYLPVMVKIPGSELVLAKKRGADVASIDFIGEIKDDYGGTTVENIRDHVDFKVSDKTAEELAKRPIYSSSGYTLLPGKYTIKVLVRDDATGKIGTFQTTFLIPNLNKETKRVPISSVVLSSQRTPMTEAVYNASKGKEQAKEIAADPLIQNGAKLIPSVTRVFSKGRSLYVYLQAYEGAAPAAAAPASVATSPPKQSLDGAPGTGAAAAAAAAPTVKPLIAFVSFYQNGAKVYETQPQEVTPLPNTRLQVTPLNFTIDLSALTAGKYDCQVTVLDPNGGKGAFWQAPIMLVQ
jgi:VWFA-related protein